jgi:hypothetical protein
MKGDFFYKKKSLVLSKLNYNKLNFCYELLSKICIFVIGNNKI